MPVLTLKRLREVLRYEPHSGVFYWRVMRGNMHPGSRAGSSGVGESRITICIDYRHYKAHRLAWFYMVGRWPTAQIDHRNRNKNDNRWRNLRQATHKQNMENRRARKDSSSGVRGVYFDRGRKLWRPHIRHNDKQVFLGRFATRREAIVARKKAERLLFTHSL